MGTLVNGLKEIFATAKTTGSNVMLCGNDGTPDGHMTFANLASVLGDGTLLTSSDDLNNITTVGNYYWVGSNRPAHAPADTNSSFMEVRGTKENVVIQMVYYGANSMHIRQYAVSAQTWGDWYRNDNYGTSSLAELAASLGVKFHVNSISLSDDDALKALDKKQAYTGVCVSVANMSWVLYFHVPGDQSGNTCMQFIFGQAQTGYAIKYRMFWDSWGSWKTITTT